MERGNVTMAPSPFFLLFFSFFTGEVEAAESAYEVLRAHGLPIGLFPKGVREFSVGEGGRFEAKIERPCTATFESGVRYDASVAEVISYGQIASLSGVSAQDLFLWFPVKGIFVKEPGSGIIFFDVGVVQKQFSLSLFETPLDRSPDHKAAEIEWGEPVIVDDGDQRSFVD